jgi:hypothetical protein
LNSVYRGHITQDSNHLSFALKIIMHANYMYTRDHPQRNHQPMELDLDEVIAADAVDIPPMGEDTGFTAEDFSVGDRVQIWHANTWWSGKITYISVAGSISVRLVGARDSITGILPSQTKPVPPESDTD